MAKDGGLRQLWRKHMPRVHWVSIESGFTEQGIPDMNGCCDGYEFWIEDKVTHGWAVGMRPEQVAWLSRRRRAGGNCFVAVRRVTKAGPRRTACDELYIFDGAYAATLKLHGLRGGVKPIIITGGGPSAWNWKGVAAALLQLPVC